MSEAMWVEEGALGQAGLDALAKERAARRKAESEVRELRKFRRKFYEMRDKAELWEARAIRYSNQLKQQKINNA